MHMPGFRGSHRHHPPGHPSPYTPDYHGNPCLHGKPRLHNGCHYPDHPRYHTYHPRHNTDYPCYAPGNGGLLDSRPAHQHDSKLQLQVAPPVEVQLHVLLRRKVSSVAKIAEAGWHLTSLPDRPTFHVAKPPIVSDPDLLQPASAQLCACVHVCMCWCAFVCVRSHLFWHHACPSL